MLSYGVKDVCFVRHANQLGSACQDFDRPLDNRLHDAYDGPKMKSGPDSGLSVRSKRAKSTADFRQNLT
jgi:hypothetical protein